MVTFKEFADILHSSVVVSEHLLSETISILADNVGTMEK